jgi:hypothetical protein
VRQALADLRALSPSELLVFTQLTALAVGCRAALRAVPLDRISRVARSLGDHPSLLAGRALPPERLAQLADLAARITGRRSRCLVRSLLLFALLRGRGEPIAIVIGMARRAQGLHGHAWIERGGEVVGETLPAGLFTRCFAWEAWRRGEAGDSAVRMSAIAGILRLDGAPVEEAVLRTMASAMPGRCPDGVGIVVRDEVGLVQGLFRTGTTAVEEAQPAVRGHLSVVADARIDNRGEIFAALGVSGPDGDSFTDTEVILRCYEAWGADCVDRIVGDFAFAVWDRGAVSCSAPAIRSAPVPSTMHEHRAPSCSAPRPKRCCAVRTCRRRSTRRALRTSS